MLSKKIWLKKELADIIGIKFCGKCGTKQKKIPFENHMKMNIIGIMDTWNVLNVEIKIHGIRIRGLQLQEYEN